MMTRNQTSIVDWLGCALAAQDIPLNNSGARIRRRSAYLKSGGVVEEQRSDSREGILRSQLTISPEGHCHIRCAPLL